MRDPASVLGAGAGIPKSDCPVRLGGRDAVASGCPADCIDLADPLIDRIDR